MSKFIAIGGGGANVDDFANLSDECKKDVLDAMFGDTLAGNLDTAILALGCSIEKDNEGQIVLYTGMKERAIIGDDTSYEIVSVDDEAEEADETEVELEEEEEEEGDGPPTLRMIDRDL